MAVHHVSGLEYFWVWKHEILEKLANFRICSNCLYLQRASVGLTVRGDFDYVARQGLHSVCQVVWMSVFVNHDRVIFRTFRRSKFESPQRWRIHSLNWYDLALAKSSSSFPLGWQISEVHKLAILVPVFSNVRIYHKGLYAKGHRITHVNLPMACIPTSDTPP